MFSTLRELGLRKLAYVYGVKKLTIKEEWIIDGCLVNQKRLTKYVSL